MQSGFRKPVEEEGEEGALGGDGGQELGVVLSFQNHVAQEEGFTDVIS